MTELQKKELKAKIQSGSLVAPRALSQWNKLNTTIRGVVSTMKVNCKQKSVLICYPFLSCVYCMSGNVTHKEVKVKVHLKLLNWTVSPTINTEGGGGHPGIPPSDCHLFQYSTYCR